MKFLGLDFFVVIRVGIQTIDPHAVAVRCVMWCSVYLCQVTITREMRPGWASVLNVMRT